MRSLLIFSLLLLWSLCANAQTPPTPLAKTSLYLEVLGNGGLYSVNVERLLSAQLGARVGFATWTIFEACEHTFAECEESFVTFPLLGNVLFGRGSSRLEVGAGLLLVRRRFESVPGAVSDRSRTILDVTGVVGYRYQRPTGGLLFRIGLTPFLALSGGEDAYPDSGLFLSGGASLGYTF